MSEHLDSIAFTRRVDQEEQRVWTCTRVRGHDKIFVCQRREATIPFLGRCIQSRSCLVDIMTWFHALDEARESLIAEETPITRFLAARICLRNAGAKHPYSWVPVTAEGWREWNRLCAAARSGTWQQQGVPA